MAGARVDARSGRAHGAEIASKVRKPRSNFRSVADCPGSAEVAGSGSAGDRYVPTAEPSGEGSGADTVARLPPSHLGRAGVPLAAARDLPSAAALYVLGNAELLNSYAIAIVGSRRPTPYGNRMAERLGRDLADRA